jgi:hypothetical protein
MNPDPDDARSSPSGSRPFFELALGRRRALQALAATAAGAAAGCSIFGPSEGRAPGAASRGVYPGPGPTSLGFTPVPSTLDDRHRVAAGYRADVLLRWGDPVLAEAPPFRPLALDAQDQARQFGYNPDFLAFLPLPRGSSGSDHGLLCVNHEYTNSKLMWPGSPKGTDLSPPQAEIEMAAHGHTVVEVRREAGRWRAVPGGPFAARRTLRTRLRISGPAAGDERMKTSADPTGAWVLGLLNN